LAKNNTKTLFKPCKTLKQLFKVVKDKLDPMLGPGVYQIPCSCGKSYIGQTSRALITRLKEHIADTTHNCISKLVVVELSHKYKLLICFDKTTILASTPFYFSRIIHEALKIKIKHPNNFNCEDGYKLNHSWKLNIHLLNH